MAYLDPLYTRNLEPLGIIPGPTLPKGTRAVPFTGRDIPLSQYELRLNKIKEVFKTFHVDYAAPYRSLKYLGSYLAKKNNPGGEVTNVVMRRIMWLWDSMPQVTKYRMTDTSVLQQQALIRKKIDIPDVLTTKPWPRQ